MSGVCLVLNNAYQPLGGVSWEEAICQIVDGAAESLVEDKTKPFRSQHLTVYAPKVILLKHYIPSPLEYRPETPTNSNLFRRDGYRCQYCGRTKKDLESFERLTCDHIIPRNRGGTHEWKNITTSCNTCNHTKADRTLKEARMALLSKPTIPFTWMIRGKAKLTPEQLQYAEKFLGFIEVEDLDEA